MKTALALLAIGILIAFVSLLLPTSIRLELYDVQDVTTYSGEWSSSLVLVDQDFISGEDLANRISALLPGWKGDSKRSMQYQNGLMIARATTPQHLAIQLYLAAYRAKTTISAKLFGIIWK